MKKLVLGKTGLEAYRLGFGGIPIQRVSEEAAVECVRRALDKGIDFLDTSRAYTTSERRIGLALKGFQKKIVLATKTQQRTADGARKDVDVSLKDLQRDYIDLYQSHFVSDEETYKKVIGPGGALEGLLKAKDEGLIGHIGITSHSLDLLVKIVEDGLFETIMTCFSFLEPKAREKVIPMARAKGIGVMAMKPFSGGVIDDPAVALKWALAEPDVLVLAGVEDKALVDQNWAVFQGDWRMSPAEEEALKAIAAEYDKAFCRRCNYCQPCTEGIPIQTVLGLKSMVKRMGKHILGGGDRKAAIEKARNCSECGECMTRCPYELPIPELIKKNLAWVDEQLKTA